MRLLLAEGRTLEGGCNLGPKQMHFYPDLEVIFTNAKVTDIQ